MQESTPHNTFAAIDLGSNSFHMVVAVQEGDSIRYIDSLRTPVRLGEGLDEHSRLKPATQALALDTLAQFGQRLQGIPSEQIRIVGTNTLRRARDATQFMQAAHAALGKRIDIISGREEARLIFLAVSHAQPAPDNNRLVIDIGGGSTELIIGKGFTPKLMESISMGCVSYNTQFMKERGITAEQMQRASLEAQQALQPIARAYLDEGWSEVIGRSGTMKAVSCMLAELNMSDGTITCDALNELIKLVVKTGGTEGLALQSISADRSAVICGGIPIVHGLMTSLSIDQINACSVALREGLILDMINKAA